MEFYKCGLCGHVSAEEDWNKYTQNTIGDIVSGIKECPEFMFCPHCHEQIFGNWDEIWVGADEGETCVNLKACDIMNMILIPTTVQFYDKETGACLNEKDYEQFKDRLVFGIYVKNKSLYVGLYQNDIG